MPVPDEIDLYGNRDPVCPYCGAEQGDFWEVDANSGTHECDGCSRTFLFSRHVSVAYSTKPIVGPHRLDGFFQHEDADDNPR